MIDALMYLVTCTHPDLAFCISYLSQFSSCLLDIYHTAVKKVFQYIFGTRSYVLVYPCSGSVKLEGFSDTSLLIVLILFILILVTSFNLGSVLSPCTPRNNNASPTPLPKRNTLHYPRLLDKPNGILMPSSNLT